MDASRYKRRVKQTRRQSPTLDFVSAVRVPKSDSVRSSADPVKARSVSTAPLLRTRSVMIPKIENRHANLAATTHKQPEKPLAGNEKIFNPAPTQKRRLPAIDMGLPGQESSLHTPHIIVRKSRLRGMKKRTLHISAVSAVLCIGIIGLLFSQGYIKLHKVFRGNATSAASLTANVNPDLLKGEGDGRVNVLLLGRGGGSHDAPDLTDTIILASIDPVNSTASLLSIPRDLWVNVPSQGAMKINAAWEMGEFKHVGRVAPGSNDPLAVQAGFNMADQVVEEVLGVPIHYNMLLDFKAFQQAINTVNGVAVNVPTDLVDPSMAWENNYNPVLAKAGSRTFNGKDALMYVRSRHTSSDFARSERQRAVMMALKDKVDDRGTLSNPVKIAGLLSAFGNNVQTDLSLKDATRMYSILKAIQQEKVTSIGLAEGENRYLTTGSMSGQSVVYPSAGVFDYSAIKTFVRKKLPDGYIVKENAKILILNGTKSEGLATARAAELRSYGYNVVAVGQAPTQNYAKTQLIKLDQVKDRYKYTTNYLQKRLNLTARTSMADKTIKANGANFVIIVGSDETNSP